MHQSFPHDQTYPFHPRSSPADRAKRCSTAHLTDVEPFRRSLSQRRKTIVLAHTEASCGRMVRMTTLSSATRTRYEGLVTCCLSPPSHPQTQPHRAPHMTRVGPAFWRASSSQTRKACFANTHETAHINETHINEIVHTHQRNPSTRDTKAGVRAGRPVREYLAHKKLPPTWDHCKALGIGLL